MSRVPAPPTEHEFQAMYEAELAYVITSLRRLAVPARDVEDLAHDVFVVAYRRWGEYDRTRPIRPWLFGIALNTARRALARTWRQCEELGSVDDRPEVVGPAPEDRELLFRALACLDGDQRAAFVMFELNAQSAPEIAEALGLSVNTVYSRVRLARERLSVVVRRLRGGHHE